MRTEASCSTRGIQGFSSRGSARHVLSIPFVFRATIERSAFSRAKAFSGSGSGTTTTTTAFSRAIEDLPNALPFSGVGTAKQATRFYADAPEGILVPSPDLGIGVGHANRDRIPVQVVEPMSNDLTYQLKP
jgi:hypothetical protein